MSTQTIRPLFIVSSIDARDGGPTAGVAALTCSLASMGLNPTILALRRRGENPSDAVSGAVAAGVRVRYVAVTRNPVSTVLRFISAARWEIARHSNVSLHGYYLWGSVVAAWLCRILGTPYGIQPHGSLDVDQDLVSARKKNVFRWLVGNNLIFHAGALVVATELECEKLPAHAAGADVHVVGIAVSDEIVNVRQAAYSVPSSVLYLGRIAEKKRVDVLISAVAIVRGLGVDVRLDIAGDGDAALLRSLKSLVRELGMEDVVRWHGQVEGARRLRLYSHAQVFCLPSERENFAIAVAEALFAGLPVVTTRAVATSVFVERAGAGAVVDCSAIAVAAGIRDLVTSPVRWSDASVGALEVAHAYLGSDAVARNWVEAFVAMQVQSNDR